jgi:hypothetical protein
MWYGDPGDPRRAARYARRNARRAAHYARRSARRAYRYRYGRPGGGILGFLLVLFLIFWFTTHFWTWLIMGIFMLAIIAIVFWLVRTGMVSTWFSSSQQPQPPPQYYQPPQETQQPYQSYEQGYQQPQTNYQEGEQPYPYPPQSTSPGYQQYEEPQAQYPEQMPPMQQ